VKAFFKFLLLLGGGQVGVSKNCSPSLLKCHGREPVGSYDKILEEGLDYIYKSIFF
jgi:hypothetical protein